MDDSHDLRPDQVARLRQALVRQLDYLNRLCARMQQRWPLNDPVYREALRARAALEALYTVSGAVGRGGG